MYLLEMDIPSNLAKRTPSNAPVARLASVPREAQFTSSITLGEMFCGAYRLPEPTNLFQERLDTVLLPNLSVLPFDVAAAHRYGEMRAELERRGKPLGEADLKIGAIALTRGLTVVTGNVRHSQRTLDLSVENWLKG